MYFYDSHGGLWSAVAPTAEGAVAFGPTGCARPASQSECVSYAEAAAAGRIAPLALASGDVWDVLLAE